ncbi:MAG: hypothetical protein HUU54_16220 [Ignavibacteriaceae bacterium]|nr:hypothetical protein [Ignavibacteriaceae bacterium]
MVHRSQVDNLSYIVLSPAVTQDIFLCASYVTHLRYDLERWEIFSMYRYGRPFSGK